MARAWKRLRHEVLQDICGQPPVIPQLSLVQRPKSAMDRLDATEAALRAGAVKGAFEEAKLASLLDLKGQHLDAQDILKRCAAMGTTEERAAMGLLEHLVHRHVCRQEEREKISKTTSRGDEAKQTVKPVEVLSAQVSREEVWRRFIEPGIPCVLRGVQLAPFRNLRDVTTTVGKVKVPIRRCDESSANWARLEFDRVVHFDDFVTEFIQPYEHGLAAPRNSPQLFDFSIWQQCAESWGNQLFMPSKWFPVDLYTYASAQMQPVSGSACPTLFVAPCGSGSSLHVDTLQTNFWMFMSLGRKRWRLVSKDQIALLHPQYLCDLNPVFPEDLNVVKPNVTIYETELEAGDLIFVPAGWPHQVDNLETSVAISANFIDTSNVHRCIEEADIMASVEENSAFWAKVLRTALQQKKPELLASSVMDNEPLRHFKSRHGEKRAPYEIQRRLLQGLSATLSIGGLCILLAWYRSTAGGSSRQSSDFRAKTL